MGISNTYSSDDNGASSVSVTGGTIVGEQYGIYSRGYPEDYMQNVTTVVTGGTIMGYYTSGIYNGEGSELTLGENDETVNTETPEIIGNVEIGVDNNGGEMFFYDGIIKGKEGAIVSESEITIPDGYIIDETTEKSDEEYYYEEGYYHVATLIEGTLTIREMGDSDILAGDSVIAGDTITLPLYISINGMINDNDVTYDTSKMKIETVEGSASGRVIRSEKVSMSASPVRSHNYEIEIYAEERNTGKIRLVLEEGFATNAKGMQTARYTREITVIPKELVSIRIDKQPDKTTYIEGEDFDTTGMVVRAVYNNAEVLEITSYTVVDGTDLSLGKNSVTISYEEDGITKTATVTIVVEESEPTPEVEVTGVSVSPTTLNLEVGKTATLTATITPNNADNQNITWSSSAETVATVRNGVVTAIGEGEATITVTTEDGGYTAICRVTVTEPEEPTPEIEVTGVSVSPTTLNLEVGKTATLTATITPSNADNQNITWSSSAETVATVRNGVVTAVGEGDAIITVTTEDGGYTATCRVTVTDSSQGGEDPGEEPGGGTSGGEQQGGSTSGGTTSGSGTSSQVTGSTDRTQATTSIPQTGINQIVLWVAGIILVNGTIIFIRYRRMKY